MRSLLLSIGILSLFFCTVRGEEIPEIDFALNVKLSTPPTHQTAYLENMTFSLRSCFGSMAAPAAPAPLKDGAAKYRLFIDGTVAIVFGNTVTQEKSEDTAKLGGFFQITYFLPIQHTGTLQLKLCKWDGQKYTDVEKWTAPVPSKEYKGGRIEVATAIGGGGAVPKMPWSVEEAQLRSYSSVMPGPMGDAVFAHWLQITPQRAVPSKSNPPPSAVSPITNFDVELSIKNSSPWTVRRLSSNVAYQGQVLHLGEVSNGGYWASFPESIPPGKTTRATAPARLADKTTHPGILGLEISK